MFKDNILHATRSCGITFAQSFIFLMEARFAGNKMLHLLAIKWLAGGFKVVFWKNIFGTFTPKIGEMIQFD